MTAKTQTEIEQEMERQAVYSAWRGDPALSIGPDYEHPPTTPERLPFADAYCDAYMKANLASRSAEANRRTRDHKAQDLRRLKVAAARLEVEIDDLDNAQTEMGRLELLAQEELREAETLLATFDINTTRKRQADEAASEALAEQAAATKQLAAIRRSAPPTPDARKARLHEENRTLIERWYESNRLQHAVAAIIRECPVASDMACTCTQEPEGK